MNKEEKSSKKEDWIEATVIEREVMLRFGRGGNILGKDGGWGSQSL